MTNTATLPPILKAIKARPGAYVRFGYICRDGEYAFVEGVVDSIVGVPATGDQPARITGIRLRYMGHPNIRFGHGRITAFSVDGIERGEAIRAEREAARQRTQAAIARDAQPTRRKTRKATERQIRYVLHLCSTYRCGLEPPTWEELAEMNREEISMLIAELRGDL